MINKTHLCKTIPWWGVLFLGAGWLFILAPVCTGGFMPGDNCDSRFNLYVLEHFYRWLTGVESSLLDAPFFYPYPMTIGFSDPHTLTGFIYSILRFTGWEPIQAFCGWFALGNILNFLSAYWVIKKLGLRDFGAGMGAFLYAFSLPVTSQYLHAQLSWRCIVPLVILCLDRFLKTRNPLYLGYTMVLFALQTAMSFYIGFFLLLLSIGWVIGWLIWQFRNKRIKENTRSINLLYYPWTRREGIIFAMLTLSTLAVLFWGLWPNLLASLNYGFRREWSEIASGLPRPIGYIQALHSNIWCRDQTLIPNIPMWWEQNLFPGILATAACVMVCIPSLWNQREIIATAKWSIIFLIAITLSVGGSAIYMAFIKLPGFDVIRSVSRIILVVLFPVSLVGGALIERLSTVTGKNSVVRILAFVTIAFTLCEAAHITMKKTSSNECATRLENLRIRVLKSINGAPIGKGRMLVLLRSKEAAGRWNFEEEVDAMLLSQEMGLATLNGYSGNIPQGWHSPTCLQDILKDVTEASRFRKAHGFPEVPNLVGNMIVIGPENH